MAIGSPVPLPHAAQTSSTPATGIDIDAWTISALQSLSVSPIARGTGTPLSIPIDDHLPSRARAAAEAKAADARRAVQFDADEPATPPRRPPSRRDSMARREALLKGKEGSRQRRRWENDRLIGVPNAQPPQPSDWQVQPTHPIHNVPYQIAQFWDRGVRDRVDDKTRRLQDARKKQQLLSGSATGLGVGEVPRDLRESAKRSPAVRGWVRALEEPVRQFVHAHMSGAESAEESEELDSDEEEIVFVGRSDALRALQEKKKKTTTLRAARSESSGETGVVFDAFGDDESASYKRWLTHSISDYYGLASRSVLVGGSSQKVVYVGLKQVRNMAAALPKMPRPLWEVC
ncbi:uv-damaged DNA-binding [Cordyceps militaris]|uniref:Uv-damaged DNA-binding n=1 Tax=Cordyceps militaris TaxID=73501 RepID=A0A2H4SKR2_CORMI|nr:uv-damaged DNA-binding [Cordyceps militaris]